MRAIRFLRNCRALDPVLVQPRAIGAGQDEAREHQEEVGGEVAALEGRMDLEQRDRRLLCIMVEHHEEGGGEPQGVQCAAAHQIGTAAQGLGGSHRSFRDASTLSEAHRRKSRAVFA